MMESTSTNPCPLCRGSEGSEDDPWVSLPASACNKPEDHRYHKSCLVDLLQHQFRFCLLCNDQSKPISRQMAWEVLGHPEDCPYCLKVATDDMVLFTSCRHTVHADCFRMMVLTAIGTEAALTCPNCATTVTVKSLWQPMFSLSTIYLLVAAFFNRLSADVAALAVAAQQNQLQGQPEDGAEARVVREARDSDEESEDETDTEESDDHA
jgi:hypothetical protein